jgi:hypothetical protein
MLMIVIIMLLLVVVVGNIGSDSNSNDRNCSNYIDDNKPALN